MSVFTQYVLPGYREQSVSLKLMRAAIRIARDSGSKVLAYTHRKGDWRYETIYKELT
jgi:GNAT superfamily N-acetyltransferase